ncbi:FprA family A-type flavoprotein [Holdemanella biformis]|uniref:FprA family A-type flavoprotein n=1 Tax=Holdemanella biformis TaxID=1735 RepID=UPI00265D7F50|nr:FprA family A-type flavoprotein [Holdemanella biformis]
MKRAKKIIDNVYWVGVRDLNNRHFHGDLYPIDEGCTYNAYLVVDDEVTLFDTVEEEFTEELLERVESVLQGREIDNIVVQHTEPDHSGGFKKVYAKYPNAKVYASISGKKNMIEQYFDQVPYQVVKTNDSINTGKYDFVFVEMQMIHWPDNMLTYSPQLKTVFSNDAFGQHIVNFNLTDEGLDKAYCLKQAKEYFANIVLPYTAPVQAKLNLILGMNLDIEYIMPAHGIIWKDYIGDIIETYKGIAAQKTENKAVIVYESVWKHTQQIAESLAEGFSDAGMDVKVYKLSDTKSSIVMREIMDAKVVCIGSGTYNNVMAPSVAAFLEHIRPCKLKNKKGLAFAAYGWFNQVAKEIDTRMQQSGIESCHDVINQCYTPSDDQLEDYYNIAKEIAKKCQE